MKRWAWGVLLISGLLSAGCSITNYPLITDSRGDYSGVIRTGHAAYIIPTAQVVTIWSDGSDETFTTVMQNQYGHRRLYSQCNYDPTATVKFLDNTYCDWRHFGCAYMTAFDPYQDWLDDPFDYEEFDPDCSGARTTCVLLSIHSRTGECGDWLKNDMQNLAAEFANLPETSFRGERAYVLPINAANTTISLRSREGVTTEVPLYGSLNGFIDSKLRVAFPMTPNMRIQAGWLRHYIAEHGDRHTVELSYGSLTSSVDVRFLEDALAHNAGRF